MTTGCSTYGTVSRLGTDPCGKPDAYNGMSHNAFSKESIINTYDRSFSYFDCTHKLSHNKSVS